MFGLTRKGLLLVVLALLLLAGGGWFYSQRVTTVDLAAYVPESAIGYLEINDWTELADDLAGTRAWQDLAPAYGLWDKWPYLGEAATIIRATGLGRDEWVVLARAQLALVVTSLELRGEEVKPRLALIAETHTSPAKLERLIGSWMPQIASALFSEAQAEASEYAGIPVSIYRGKVEGGGEDRRLFSARIGSEWILSNHTEAIEAAIDARQGRAPNMAGNFYLQQARPVVGGEMFGFVSGKGVTRLAQFGAHLAGRELLGESQLGEALQALLVDLSGQLAHGIGYGLSFDDRGSVDRYVWFLQPQLVDQLRAAIRVREGKSRLLETVPASAEDLTIIGIADAETTYGAIEQVISSRLGAAESFLFRRFVLGAREALLGLGEGETATGAFGDELASIDLGPGGDEQVWMIEARDRDRLQQIIERYLTRRGASIRREAAGGAEILVSSDERRGAAAFVSDFLALGSRRGLVSLLAEGEKLTATAAYRGAPKVEQPAPVVSYTNVGEETGRMMEVMRRILPRSAPARQGDPDLSRLPLSVSRWTIDERGVVVEARGVMGSLPFIFNLFNGDGERAEPGSAGVR